MFIRIEKNSDGSHASQRGGTLQKGWAYWNEKLVPVPTSFPYVDFEVKEVHHKAITIQRGEKTITLVPAFTRLEVVSATERKIPLETEPYVSQMDMIEAQVAYTAMMTNTLLEA